MGILDDAIREHLELKRQHGADDTDLERLENEAFGPPSRPGDPDFEDEQAEFTDHAEAEGSEEPTSFMPSQAETPGPEGDPLAVAPPEADLDADLPPAEPEASAAAPATGEAPAESEEDWLSGLDSIASEEGAAPEASEAEELTGTERGRIDHAELDDTVDHPTVPEGGESEPPEAPERAIFDGDDEPEDEPVADAHTEEREAPVELTLDEDDDLDLKLPADAATEHELPEIPAEGEGTEGDEDLLEETPDFLQDAPEGERLWFEQGEPKDFDFDDEDD